MKIKEILEQSRRDLYVIYECEHCGHTEKGDAYDDRNFHENVIPEMACKSCGKKAGDNYVARETKYAEGMVV